MQRLRALEGAARSRRDLSRPLSALRAVSQVLGRLARGLDAGGRGQGQTLATGAPWAPPQGRRTGRVPKIGRLSVSLILAHEG